MDPVRFARLEELEDKFAPKGRVRVTMNNLDLVQDGVMVEYRTDHGWRGSWAESGTVIKQTDRSLTVLQEDGNIARITKDWDSLRRRRVYLMGTKEERDELRVLLRERRDEEREAVRLQYEANRQAQEERRVRNLALERMGADNPHLLGQYIQQIKQEEGS